MERTARIQTRIPLSLESLTGLILLATAAGSPAPAPAGFIVAPPPAELALDGQTTDWITITSNSNGDAGVGTLHGGTLNVGVEGLTNIGDLTIEKGGRLDADRIDSSATPPAQYQGTINVGRYLTLRTGGQMILNQDTLNVLGWSSGTGGNASLSQDASLDATRSTLNIAKVLNLYGTSGMTLSESTVNAMEFGLGGTNVLTVDDSTLNVTNRFGVGLGTGDASTVTFDGSTLHAGFASFINHGIITFNNSDLEFKSFVSIQEATVNQAGGSFGMGDELFVRSGGSFTLSNRTLRHQSLGDPNNRGTVVVDAGQLRLDGSTLDLVSAGGPDYGQRLGLTNGGRVTVDHSTIRVRTLNANGSGSLYEQDGGSIEVLTLSTTNGGEIDLDTTTVDVTGNLNIKGTFDATDSTLQVAGDVIGSENGTTLSLSDTDVSARSLVTHQTTHLDAAGGTLNITNAVDLWDSSGMTLTNTTVNADEFGLGGTNVLTVENSTLEVTNRFGVGLGTGDASTVTLGNATLDAGIGNFGANSTTTVTGSDLGFRNMLDISQASFTQTGGSLDFGDDLFIQAGGSLAMDQATLRHQDLGDPDNRGTIVVDAGQLSLSNSSLDLVSAGGPDDGQRIGITNGGQVSVDASTIRVRTLNADGSGSLYEQRGGSIEALTLSTTNGGEIDLDTATVDVTGNLNIKGTFGATDSTLQVAGDVIGSENGTLLSFTDTDVSARSLVTHQTTHLDAAGGTLNIANAVDLWDSSSMTLTNTTVNADEFGLGGTNALTVENSTLNVTNRFGVGLGTGDASTVSLKNTTLHAGLSNLGDNATVTLDGSDLSIRGTMNIQQATVTQTGGSLAIGDELFVRTGGALAVDHTTLLHQDLGDADNRGTIVVDGGQLALSSSTMDLASAGGHPLGQRFGITGGGEATAQQSDITARSVSVSGTGSRMAITGTSLTAESLLVDDGGVFQETDSTVKITGNTTRVENGGLLDLVRGEWNEHGDLIVENSRLQTSGTRLAIDGDLRIFGSSTAELLDETRLLIGDDLLFDADDYNGWNLDRLIVEMLGLGDNEGDGTLFDLGTVFSLGGLFVGNDVHLRLMDDITVDDLTFYDSVGMIDLNGHDLTVLSSFQGEMSQIDLNGGSFIYNPQSPVPEPALLVLAGLGLTWLAIRIRTKSKKRGNKAGNPS